MADTQAIISLTTGELVELAKVTMDEIKEKYSIMHIILKELNERSINAIIEPKPKQHSNWLKPDPITPKDYDQDLVYPPHSIKD